MLAKSPEPSESELGVVVVVVVVVDVVDITLNDLNEIERASSWTYGTKLNIASIFHLRTCWAIWITGTTHLAFY